MLIENFSTLLSENIEEESIVTRILIHSDHPLFGGHFPGTPITPGVMMIQSFLEQAERFTGSQLQLVVASNIKFLTLIEPTEETVVSLESEIKTVEDQVELIGKALHKEAISIKLKLTFKIISK